MSVQKTGQLTPVDRSIDAQHPTLSGIPIRVKSGKLLIAGYAPSMMLRPTMLPETPKLVREVDFEAMLRARILG
jgi:hypothetical protein